MNSGHGGSVPPCEACQPITSCCAVNTTSCLGKIVSPKLLMAAKFSKKNNFGNMKQAGGPPVSESPVVKIIMEDGHVCDEIRPCRRSPVKPDCKRKSLDDISFQFELEDGEGRGEGPEDEGETNVGQAQVKRRRSLKGLKECSSIQDKWRRKTLGDDECMRRMHAGP